MAGGRENLSVCAALLKAAPDKDAAKRLMTGLQMAFQGAVIPELPADLSQQLDQYGQEFGKSDVLLGIQRGDPAAIKTARGLLANPKGDPVEKLEIARAFGTISDPTVVPPLLSVLGLDQESALKRVALQSLAGYNDSSIPAAILSRYGSTLPEEHDVRGTANRVMAGRLEWARMFLQKIDLAHIKARHISPDVVQLLLQHKDAEINQNVAKHWPEMRAKSTAENQAEMTRIRSLLESGRGDATSGKLLFQQRCAVCHKLFGEGGIVAPDLTGYERSNLDFWLPGIIDPSLEIREEFVNFLVKTNDSQMMMGMISEQSPQSITVRDAANQVTTISRGKILKLEASPISLMPPGLLLGLDDQQMRDLFAFLRK